VTAARKALASEVIEDATALATTIRQHHEEVATCRPAFTGSSRRLSLLGRPMKPV
jgi:hypothetical protein